MKLPVDARIERDRALRLFLNRTAEIR